VTHTLGTLSIGAQTLTVASGANVNSGTAGLTFGATTLSASGAVFTANAGTQLTLGAVSGTNTAFFVRGSGGVLLSAGVSTGTGGINKGGSGVLTLSAANTYTGATVVNAGTVQLSGTGNLGSGSAVTVSADGSAGTTAVLNLAGLSATIGTLTLGGTSGAGLVSNTVQTGAGTLTLGGNVTFNGDLGNQGTNLITGNLNLGGATRTFTTNGAGKTLAVSAAITNGGISKAGAGTLTMSGNNSFAGGVAVTAGALRATTSANALGAGTLTLSGGALELANDTGLNFARNTTVSANTTITSDRLTAGAGVTHTLGTLSIGANTLSVTAGGNVLTGTNYGLTFGGATVATGSVFDVANNGAGVGALTLGALTGNVNFTKQGAGVLVLGAASSRTAGVTTVSAGTLRLGSVSALGTTGASLSLSGGAVLDLASDTTVNGYNVALGGNATIVSNNATAASAGITHSLGTLTMGANTLSVSRGANATGTGGVSLGAVSLSAGGGVFDAAADSSLTLASVSGTNTAFSIGGAGTTAVSGVIGTGTGGVTKTGAGTLTFSGANTYTGTTTIGGGTLQAGAANVIATGSVVDVASGATFGLAGFNQSVGGVTGAGNVTLGSGTLTIGSAGVFGLYSGQMTGTGALVKTGAGESMFSGASSFGGGTTVQAGILQLTGTGSLTSAVTVNGSGALFYQTSSVKGPNIVLQSGGVTIDGTSRSVGSLTVSGGTISNGPGAAAPVLTADGATFSGAATINLTISGNTNPGLALVGGLTGPGTGTVTVNPTNLAGSWANGTYDLISYGGAIANAGGFSLGTVTGKGGRQAAVLSNPSGKLMMTISGSTVTYTGSGGGNWTMNNGAVTNFKLTEDNTVTYFQTADTAVFDQTASNQTLNIVDDIDAAALTFASGDYVINSSGGKKITGATSIVVNGATLTLNTANDYSGTVQLNSGRINLGNANGLGATNGVNGAIIFGNNVTLSNTSGGALTTPNYPLSFNGQMNFVGSNNLNLGSGPTSLVTNTIVNVETATLTLGGVVDASGAQTFTKLGAGVLVMSGGSENGYAGETQVSGGVLALGKSANVLSINGDIVIGDGIGTDTLRTDAAGQIASAVSLTFNAAGSPVFDLSGNNQEVGRLSSTNAGAAISLGAATLTVGGGDGSGGFAGVISGTGGGLTKVGTGTLTVSGANSYTGTTTISAGILQVGAGGTAGSLGSGGVTNNATLAFNRSDALTVSSAISGTGAVVQNGSGTLTLAGTNGYTGVLTINAGVVSAATAGINGGSATNGIVFNGGTLRAASGGITTAKAVAMTGTGVVDTNGNAVDLSGVFSGSGVLTKSGAGTLTVSNSSNSFAGGISVTGGTLKATVPGALGLVGTGGAGSISLASGTVLQLDGSGENADTGNGIANVISGAGGLLRTFTSGTAGLSITGTAANTFTGLTQVDSGTLRLQKTGGVNAIGGDALVNGGSLILRASEQIPDAATVTVSSGTLEYPNAAGVTSFYTETVGTIVAAGGGVNTRGGSISTGVLSITGSGAVVAVNGYLATAQRGALTVSGALQFSAAGSLTVVESASGSANRLNLSGGITTTHTTGTALIATGSGAVPGELNLGSGSGAIAVADGAAATDLEISARMTGGGGGISKSGAGTLELSGSAVNDYSGATTVTGGVLRLNKSGAGNGAVPGALSVTSGGTVEIAASEQIGDSSEVTVGSGAVFTFSGSGLTETVGTFTNSGGDFSTGANNLVGTGSSIYWESGVSTINEGGSVSDQHFLVTGGTNTVEAGGVLTVLSGGTGLEFGGTSSPTILLNASDAVAGRMVVNGNVMVDVASGTASVVSSGSGANPGNIDMGAGVRTVTVTNGSAGSDFLVSARVENGSLIKEGAGTMEFGAVNSLTELTVNAGTVLFGVDNAVSGNVTMGGGTLALAGRDASAGVFTLSSASVLDMGGYAGSFSGSGAGLSSTLTFANSNATDGWTGLQVFNWDGAGWTGGGNDRILFSSYTGSQVVFGGSEVQFYSDSGTTVIGSGGQLVTSPGGGWELVPVPEPSTVVGVLGLIGMAAWRERRHLLRCPEAVVAVRGRVA
jgi:autotransporter-associated beta strand protein